MRVGGKRNRQTKRCAARLFADEFDPLEEYYASRKGALHRLFANHTRPGKLS